MGLSSLLLPGCSGKTVWELSSEHFPAFPISQCRFPTPLCLEVGVGPHSTVIFVFAFLSAFLHLLQDDLSSLIVSCKLGSSFPPPVSPGSSLCQCLPKFLSSPHLPVTLLAPLHHFRGTLSCVTTLHTKLPVQDSCQHIKPPSTLPLGQHRDQGDTG